MTPFSAVTLNRSSVSSSLVPRRLPHWSLKLSKFNSNILLPLLAIELLVHIHYRIRLAIRRNNGHHSIYSILHTSPNKIYFITPAIQFSAHRTHSGQIWKRCVPTSILHMYSSPRMSTGQVTSGDRRKMECTYL